MSNPTAADGRQKRQPARRHTFRWRRRYPRSQRSIQRSIYGRLRSPWPGAATPRCGS